MCAFADQLDRCNAAVVIPTTLRPTLERAVDSVFSQSLPGLKQLLIGVDTCLGSMAIVDRIFARKPADWRLLVLNPGYSTSVRHGGFHAARDGGAMRTVLSYLAHSRYVAYLDDDNWWDSHHLASLVSAIDGHDWAFSMRWFVERQSARPISIDHWESVGPGRGMFQERFGGFVDPNTLMIDKVACEPVLRLWTRPLPGDPKGMSADRNIFDYLHRHHRGRGTGKPTSFYVMDPDDPIHIRRMENIRSASRSR